MGVVLVDIDTNSGIALVKTGQDTGNKENSPAHRYTDLYLAAPLLGDVGHCPEHTVMQIQNFVCVLDELLSSIGRNQLMPHPLEQTDVQLLLGLLQKFAQRGL